VSVGDRKGSLEVDTSMVSYMCPHAASTVRQAEHISPSTRRHELCERKGGCNRFAAAD